MSIRDFGAAGDGQRLDTREIQNAIDACHQEGGGEVLIEGGEFRTATLFLKSGVILHIAGDATLRGSDEIGDYPPEGQTDGLILAHGAEKIGIIGPGTLDGADCRNPKGEEGFRGPHAIGFHDCRDIVVRDLTIVDAGNWAFDCKRCEGARIEKLRVRGGHDGFDADSCVDFRWKDCEFSTGDDCIAGSNNRDWRFENCFFNSSCNGMRISCLDLEVVDCRFQGPGEYPHQKSGRHNMQAAFVHFAPHDREYCRGHHVISDHWTVRDCVFDQVDDFLHYDTRGLWQTGRPMGTVRVSNCRIDNVLRPVFVVGDLERNFRLMLEEVEISLRDRGIHHPFLDLRTVGGVSLRDLTLRGVDGTHPVLSCVDAGAVEIQTLNTRGWDR